MIVAFWYRLSGVVAADLAGRGGRRHEGRLKIRIGVLEHHLEADPREACQVAVALGAIESAKPASSARARCPRRPRARDRSRASSGLRDRAPAHRRDRLRLPCSSLRTIPVLKRIPDDPTRAMPASASSRPNRPPWNSSGAPGRVVDRRDNAPDARSRDRRPARSARRTTQSIRHSAPGTVRRGPCVPAARTTARNFAGAARRRSAAPRQMLRSRQHVHRSDSRRRRTPRDARAVARDAPQRVAASQRHRDANTGVRRDADRARRPGRRAVITVNGWRRLAIRN